MSETFAEQKNKLISLRENYKQAVLDNVEDMKEKIISKQRLVMLGLGVLVIGYVVFKGLGSAFKALRGKKKKRIVVQSTDPVYLAEQAYLEPKQQKAVAHKEKSFLDPIIDSIKREVGLFLLAFARKKIREVLEGTDLDSIINRIKRDI